MKLKAGYKQSEVGLIPKDWEAFPLEVIADVIMGQSPSGNTYNKSGNGIALINGPTEFTKVHPVKVQWTTQPTKVCQKGDLLICVRGSSTGRMNVSNDEYCIGRGVAAIRANYKSDTVYLTHQIHLGIERLLALSAGSTFANVDGKSIRSIRIPLPPTKTEQEAIAEALSDADTLIESLEQLITKKRHLKQGAMQELLTGKKRLPGFSGEWELKRLREECELITKGTTPTSLGKNFTSDGINFIKIETLEENGKVIKDKVAFIDEETNNLLKRSQLREKDILVSIAGALGRVAVVTADLLPANTNQALAIVRLKTTGKIGHRFLFYYLNSLSIKKYIEAINVQAAQANLSLENVGDFAISFPSLPEQSAIATILSDMDTEIAALETQLAKTRQLKQGMMHELLTGKTRLI